MTARCNSNTKLIKPSYANTNLSHCVKSKVGILFMLFLISQEGFPAPLSKTGLGLTRLSSIALN